MDNLAADLDAFSLEHVTGMAHSITGGSAWEETPWRAVQRAAWEETPWRAVQRAAWAAIDGV